MREDPSPSIRGVVYLLAGLGGAVLLACLVAFAGWVFEELGGLFT